MEFLPLAEEAGLMRPLTEMILDNGLAQCAKWRAEGRAVGVSINISASNLLDAEFTELVSDLLQRHRVEAGALTLVWRPPNGARFRRLAVAGRPSRVGPSR